MTHQYQRVKVLVAGKAIDATAIRHSAQAFQDVLSQARSRFGSAMCMCRKPPLLLVIRERAERLFLAAWPDQAADHAVDCPFYSERSGGQGSHAQAGAITIVGDQFQIRLHHGLRKSNEYATPTLNPASAAVKVAIGKSNKFSRMHLWGLLHFLWEEAGLNRWHAGWRRDWGLSRHVLRRVAKSTFVNDEPLLQNLYIPPVWSEKKREENIANWQAFVEPLRTHHRRATMVLSGFVIGAVRALERTDYGHMIMLHHMAERFYMDEKVAANLAQYSRRGWSALKQMDVIVEGDEKPHVVAALRIQAAHTGRLAIVEAVLMRVSPRYIPVNSSYEDAVARLLVKQDRSFVRPLHYDHHTLNMPSFILKDAVCDPKQPGTNDVAVFVYGKSGDPSKRHLLEKADRKSAIASGLQYWRWDVKTHAQPPPFPEKAESNPIKTKPQTKEDQ